MKATIFAVTAIILALVWCGGAQAADLNMKDGLWEITTKTEMKGMPGNIPPTKVKQCLTRKDNVPSQQDAAKNTNCKMIDNKVNGNTVTWTMLCKEKDSTMENKGQMTYKGDTFDGTSVMTIKDKGGKTQQITSKMSGKRLGPCDKK
ncbi:MAG: DUF3617 family protein [Syntrophorhabdaceae bacterium]|nr:DUF3617 domain-containing protein [Syntrophorhabdaceae bacterium]MDD4195489.1 DUF3617 family protein [Syntrophorhabdaceae bacterium]HOC45953.1 DUF3617 family protein [Syntrophorhabdaceae bacterium]